MTVVGGRGVEGAGAGAGVTKLPGNYPSEDPDQPDLHVFSRQQQQQQQ